jgi:hypothetical protein
MTIWVSSLALAPQLVQAHSPQLIVSLLSPYDDFPELTPTDRTSTSTSKFMTSTRISASGSRPSAPTRATSSAS